MSSSKSLIAVKKAIRPTAVVLAFALASMSISYGAEPDGAALYGAICAKCHNSLENTTVPKRCLKHIKSAIRTNIGGMGALKYLKDDELKAIADVLKAGQKEKQKEKQEPTK
jgi:mono/diheme cytochrome c family protein